MTLPFSLRVPLPLRATKEGRYALARDSGERRLP